MLLRCLEYVANPIDKAVVGFIRVLASHISWILLYFMVFEMMKIHARIQITSLDELKRRERSIDRLRMMVFAIFVLLYTIPSILIFDPILKINSTLFKVLMFIRCAVKIPIDVWIFTKFITLFGIFVKLKIERVERCYYEKNKSNAQKFETPKHLKLIVLWTMFLAFLKALISVCALFVYGMYNFEIHEQQIPSLVLEFLYIFTLRTLYWPTDFLICLSLIYLFNS